MLFSLTNWCSLDYISEVNCWAQRVVIQQHYVQSLLESPRVPILFDAVIKDLDDETECALSKFSDITKLGETADTLESSAAIQRDLVRLQK